MRPPAALPSLKSLYKRHLFIGNKTACSLPSVFSFLCTITTSFIFSVSLSIFILSATWTNACHEWLFHCVAASFNHLSVVIYFFQGKKIFASYKVVLCGKSSNTPATL